MLIPGIKYKYRKAILVTDRVKKIIEFVCDMKNIRYEDMKKQTRKREIVYARQLCTYMLKKRTKLALREIGELFADQDHSTILHSIKVINDLSDTYEDVRLDVAFLKSNL